MHVVYVKEEEQRWEIGLTDRWSTQRLQDEREVVVHHLDGEGGARGVGGRHRQGLGGCRSRDDSRWVVRRPNAFCYGKYSAPPVAIPNPFC